MDIKKLIEFFQEEENITRAARRFAQEQGIEYNDSFRRKCSLILNKQDLGLHEVLENNTTTQTNQYESPEAYGMPSAWSKEKNRFYTIEEYCDVYGLDKNSVKSSKLVSHNASHMVYNIAFYTEEEESLLDVDSHLEEVVSKFIKPISLSADFIKKDHLMDDWFDRLVYTDTHIGMNVNGKSGDSLYEGKWDKDEVMNRLQTMINHTLTYQKGKTLIIDDLGDFLDGLGGQTTRKGHELPQNMNDKEVFEAGIEFKVSLIDSLIPYYDKIICNDITNDNHCFTPDVEILTDKGFKLYEELTKDDLVATSNKEGVLEYQKPLDYIYNKTDSEIEIHNYKSKLMDLSVTDEHRMFVSYTNSKDKSYKYILSKDISKVPMQFKCAGNNVKEDLDIDDNLIRLLAWISTDGTVRKVTNEFLIYQSKPEGIKQIKNVLDKIGCGYDFRKKVSNVKVTEVCGKVLKKEPMQMYEFVLNKKHTDNIFLQQLRDYMPIKDVPSIVFKLSKRQADIYIREYILGDGSVKKGASKSASVYGTEKILERLQILCVSNGHRATLTKNNRGHFVLCIVFDTDCINFTYSNIIKEHIKPSFTWCLTMPNSNLFVRKNGRVSLQGNSGFFAYFVSSAVEKIIKERYQGKVEVNTRKKFMEHYSVGNHTFVISHGKDIGEQKFGLKPKLDAVQADKIDQYCKENRLYDGKFIEFSKGDSHQALYDDTTSNDFQYYNYPAFSPPSNWCKTNFKNTRSGFRFYNIKKEDNIKIAIPYWFKDDRILLNKIK